MNPLDSIHSSGMFIQHLNNPYFLKAINKQNLGKTNLSQFHTVLLFDSLSNIKGIYYETT